MTRCSACQTEFEASPALSGIEAGICPTCRENESGIAGLRTVRLLFVCFGLIALLMFIPFLLIPLGRGANSAGGYTLSGRGGDISFSTAGLIFINAFFAAGAVACFGAAAFFNRLLKRKREKVMTA